MKQLLQPALLALILFSSSCETRSSKPSGQASSNEKPELTHSHDPSVLREGWTKLGPDDQFFVSASSVAELGADLNQIQPPVRSSHVPFAEPAYYLKPFSCLGYLGPLGPYGPLGVLGPILKNQSWSETVQKAPVPWEDWAIKVTNSRKELSSDGPLGHNGPLSPVQYFGEQEPAKTLFSSNDFAVHTRAFGLWAPLGPLGPLGVLGPLGPLGPAATDNSSRECSRNKNGEYICDGLVRRTLKRAPELGNKEWELFENYSEGFAAAMKDNDSSFMVEGRGKGRTFLFQSRASQIVTVVLVPEKQLDNYDLELLNASGETIATSSEFEFIDWIQLAVRKDEQLAVRVKLNSSFHLLQSSYRVFVTGSGEDLFYTNVTGPHLKKRLNNETTRSKIKP